MLFFLFYTWIILNIVAFCMYALDKSKAIRGRWRVSETSLFVVAIVGGSLGSLMAMQLFRHKTQKPAFRFAIPLIVVIHYVGVLLLLYYWLRNI